GPPTRTRPSRPTRWARSSSTWSDDLRGELLNDPSDQIDVLRAVAVVHRRRSEGGLAVVGGRPEEHPPILDHASGDPAVELVEPVLRDLRRMGSEAHDVERNPGESFEVLGLIDRGRETLREVEAPFHDLAMAVPTVRPKRRPHRERSTAPGHLGPEVAPVRLRIVERRQVRRALAEDA